LRGKIPELKNIHEVILYLRSYFRIEILTFNDYIEAARIKSEGDSMLKNAKEKDLKARSLSIVDSTVIALALRKKFQ